jgi:hypothetical protein
MSFVISIYKRADSTALSSAYNAQENPYFARLTLLFKVHQRLD